MQLKRATIKDADMIWQLQKNAFSELLAKYEDYDTSPGNESIERVRTKLLQSFTYFYYILEKDNVVGAIRVVDRKDGSAKRISPIFILHQYRNRGLAQQAMLEAEKIHGKNNWKLDTILQESGNCHLYEKMGYSKTGHTKVINKKMTIVYYCKS